MLLTFQNGHFVTVCTEKMMDNEYRESDMRHTYSNYNQMKLSLNTLQINQNNYTLSTFSLSNRRNSEDSGKMLAASVPECLIARVLWFSSTSPCF